MGAGDGFRRGFFIIGINLSDLAIIPYTEEGLKNYHVFNRRYRNRRIGEFLKEMHLTEGRNTGFKKILNVLERNGSPMPVFETDPARLSFSTTLFIHPDFHLGEAVTEEDEIGANDDIVGANGANLSENGADDALLAKNEQLIVNYVAIHPRSSSRDMAQNIPLSLRTIQRCLNAMKEKGILTFEGTRKNGEWIFHRKT